MTYNELMGMLNPTLCSLHLHRRPSSSSSSRSSLSHLDEVIDADEVAVLVVAEPPRLAVRQQSVGNVQRLGEVDHPDADVTVITDYQQRAANDLQAPVRHALYVRNQST